METVKPTDGMVITESVKLKPGVYHLPNGLCIEADNVTVDGTGVTIISGEQQGIALHIAGRKNVTVKGLSIYSFYYGIRADDCEQITITDCMITRTAELAPYKYFLYLWKPIDEAYGGAILLNQVTGGVLRDNDLQHQMNAILLYNTTGVTVEHNNGSFNSGWGVYLSAAHDNVIQDNKLDFCNRVYRRESGEERAEADAAGIIMVKGSSRNQVLRNRCRGGGDGIYVSGYDFLGGVEPCSDNVFEDNDCRYSPNNAIESNFSKNNVFRRNICSKSNYGFWMGFSWDNVVEENLIEDNFIAGIASEHAHNMTFRNNQLRRNREGIRLWTRGGGVLEHYPGYEVAYDLTIEGNIFEENWLAFNGHTGEVTVDEQCHGYHVHGNTFTDNRVGVRLADLYDGSVKDNTFTGHMVAAVQVENARDVIIEGNSFENNATDTEIS